MKDVSIPHGTDLPEERRERSETSRFKPDSQTGKKDKTGPFISPELNRHFRIFEKHKDQPPTHPSEVPTHQTTKYDRPSTLKEVVSGWKIPNFNIHPLMIPTIYRYAENLQEIIKKATESPDIDVRDHIKFSREREILHQIIVEILTRKKIKHSATLKAIITLIHEHCISEGMRLSKDEIHDIIVERTGDLPNLDIHPNLGRTTFFVTGGPANGKSTLTRLLSERNIGDLNEALVINPDNLKDVLLDSGSLDKNSAQHDDLTHEESSYIVHKLLEPELQKLIDSNIAPDVFFDVVDAKLPRIEKVSESGCNVAIYNVTCDAGTAIERAFQRGIYTNRFIPTEVVLSGSRKNAANLGMYVTLAEHFELFDTNTQDCSLIANKIGIESPLNIYEQRLFEAHLLKKHMNITADNPGALYSLQDLSAERRTKDYYDLVTQGVNLVFHDKGAGKTYAVFNHRDGIIINDVDAFIVGVRTPGGGEQVAFAAAMIQSFIVEGLDVKIRQRQAHRKSLYAKGGRLLYADRYIAEKLSIEKVEVYNESQEDPKTRHSKQGRVEEGARGGHAPRESRTRGSHFTPATGESASHPRDDRDAISTGNERELDRQY